MKRERNPKSRENNWRNDRKTRQAGTEDVLYVLLLAGGLLAVGGYLLLQKLHLEAITQGRPCLILRLTGWYCPGCGGTRAFLALLKGDIPASLYYHPVVLYMAVFLTVLFVQQSLHYLSRGRIRGFHYRGIYGYIAVLLFLMNFIIKNLFPL